jgi:curli biogenesis system outer membrane secretion channel CsgG
MKRLFLAALASTLVLAIPSPLHSQAPQGKIKIAIWDFENHAATTWWFHNQMGPAARNHIDTAFSENPKLSEMFSVVEREKLDMVLKEQGLAQTGAVDPQSAAKVGKLLGVRYVVTGGIDKFAINTTRGGIGGIGGSRTVADATINLRFIDTTTAERVISISEEGQVSKGGGFIRGASLSRDAEWGIASEAIEATSKKVVEKLVQAQNLDKVSAAAGATGGVDMRIIKVEGKTAYINIGSSSGVKVGDTFKIFSMGEALIDPATGMNLGSTEKETGSGRVTEVQERFSIMTIVTGTAAANSKLKKG